MKDKLKALARLDGYTKGDRITFPVYWYKKDKIFLANELPPYLDPLEGHGHLQRIIESEAKKDDGFLWLFAKELEKIVFGHELCEMDCRLYTATVDQKAEAIFRAKGLWKEESNAE